MSVELIYLFQQVMMPITWRSRVINKQRIHKWDNAIINLKFSFPFLYCSVFVLLYGAPVSLPKWVSCHPNVSCGRLFARWLIDTDARLQGRHARRCVYNWWRDSACALFHWKLQTKHKLCSAHLQAACDDISAPEKPSLLSYHVLRATIRVQYL